MTAFSAFLQQQKEKANSNEMLRDRSLLLDILAVFFGISAWISINGVWVELPLLVQVRMLISRFFILLNCY